MYLYRRRSEEGIAVTVQAFDLAMKKEPTQSRAKATVEAVVVAAAQLLAERGYAALTTNHIADRAGVSIGSIYQYFPGKEAIIARLLEKTVDEILTDFARGLLAMPAHEGIARYRYVAGVLYDTIDRRAAVIRAMQYEVPFLRDLPLIGLMRTRLLALSSQIYAANVGPTAFARPDVAAFLLTAMLQAAVLESILNPLPGIGRTEVIETLAEIIGRILGPA